MKIRVTRVTHNNPSPIKDSRGGLQSGHITSECSDRGIEGKSASGLPHGDPVQP